MSASRPVPERDAGRNSKQPTKHGRGKHDPNERSVRRAGHPVDLHRPDVHRDQQDENDQQRNDGCHR